MRVFGIMCAGVYQDNSTNVSTETLASIAASLKPAQNSAIIIDVNHPNLCSDENFVYNKDKTRIYGHFHSDAKEIHIPETVKYIDSRVFANYGNLEKFTVAENNPAFTAIDGVLYNKSVTEIVFIPLKLTGVFTLPSTVEKIGKKGDYDMNVTFTTKHEVTEINFSKNLKLLGKNSIFLCSSLQRINYGGTVAEWTAIEKDEDWFSPVYNAKPVLIYCTDGVLDTNGNPVNA